MRPLEEAIRESASAEGFTLFGIATAAPADRFDRFAEWLDRGYAGGMDYLRDQAEARRHPDSILPGVRSVVMVGWEYGLVRSSNPSTSTRPASPAVATAGLGQVARYARGPDYHRVVWDKLNRMHAWLEAEVPGCRVRGVADTAPLLERDLARRAGLGWVGKNTMLINKHRGSYFILGALLTSLNLVPTPPHEASHCGSCTACLDACPTNAFPAPGWLDARKCISYLTIERREPIPETLREPTGDWLFGCDICQEVCPWNRRDASEPDRIDAAALLDLDEAGFRERFRGTVLFRARRNRVLTSAAIVLGNVGDERVLPALRRALDDPEEDVREAAAWAIGRINSRRP